MRRKKHIEIRYIVLFLLVGIALLLSGLFYVFHTDRKLTFIERGIQDIGLFFEEVILSPFSFVNDKVASWNEKKYIYEKYEELKKENESYQILDAKYREQENELNELKEMLGITSGMSEGTYMNATTISRNIDYWYQEIKIDKGTSSGVKKGSAVMNAKGLIGYVTTTSKYYSTVRLLTDEIPQKISVKIEVGDSYVFGLLTSYDSKKNVFQIEGISENTGIPKDALVTTTGLGNTFPSGILIGYVSSVELDHYELAKTVYVKPSADYNDINYVTVLGKEEGQ